MFSVFFLLLIGSLFMFFFFVCACFAFIIFMIQYQIGLPMSICDIVFLNLFLYAFWYLVCFFSLWFRSDSSSVFMFLFLISICFVC